MGKLSDVVLGFWGDLVVSCEGILKSPRVHAFQRDLIGACLGAKDSVNRAFS